MHIMGSKFQASTIMIKNMFKMTKARLFIDIFLLGILVAIGLTLASVIHMPGSSYKGPFDSLSGEEADTEKKLKQHIKVLAGDIGQRNTEESLKKSVDYIKGAMAENGYKTIEQEFEVDKQTFKNLECTLKGSSDEVLLVGAHYDSVTGSLGADDNGSGVASVIEVARLCADKKFNKTIRFVFFCNEEPPYFASAEMGSYFYASRCVKNHDKIAGLLVLETLGFYTDAPNSQTYPANFTPGYPTTGNFLAFVGNQDSRQFVEKAIGAFRKECKFPSEGVAAPNWVNGVDWSDQLWFWKNGIQAVMITDTAPYRNQNYHTMQDTPDKLSYPSFSRVVVGLSKVVASLAN